MSDSTSGVTPELRIAVLKATAQGNELLPQMLAYVRAAPTQASAMLLAEIHSGMQVLYQDFEQDPRDVLVVRDFIDYYAPNAVKIAGTYVALLSTAPDSPECAESKKTLLELRRVLAEEFLAKCRENDLRDAAILNAKVSSVTAVEYARR